MADRLHRIEWAIDGDTQVIEAKGSKARRAIRDAAIAEALCIKQPEGRPADPLPKWQVPLAAFGVILLRAGLPSKRVKEAMSEAREVLQEKALDHREAARILANYEPMRSLDPADLRHLAGPELWEKLNKYLPAT